MTHVTLVTLILFAFSCCQGVTKFEDNHRVYSDSLTLEGQRVVSFPLDGMGSLHNSLGYLDYEGNEFLSLVNATQNELIVYDYSNNAFSHRIKLDQEGPDGVGALPSSSAHLMISPDSFLVYNVNYTSVYLVNDKAKVLRKYDILNTKIDKVSPVPFPSSLHPMIKVGNEVLFSCAVNSRQSNYNAYKTVLKLNLDNGQKNYIHPLPSSYNQGFWGVDFKYQVGIAYNHKNAKLILNYPINHTLIIGNLDGDMLEKRYVGSNYIKKIVPWSDDLSIGLRQPSNKEYSRITNFSFSSSDYISIRYDPYRNLFYRITHLRPSLEEVKSGQRTPDISIMILTEDLEKVGEVYLENEVYSHSMFFVSKEGIGVARRDLQRNNEDFISFEVFNIVENE